MGRTSKRKRAVKSYNEDAMAKKFEISTREMSKSRTRKASSKSSSKSSSAKRAKYVTATGKTCKAPPPSSVLEERGALPKRDKKTKRLKFTDYPEFQPNMTPSEVLQAGAFGGTYFRKIYSAVTGVQYDNKQWKEFPAEWFEGMSASSQLTHQKYDKSINKYGVKCGGDLDMWETSGWIAAIDPYGWFQWYCRFYLGRRSTDDERQIGRWKGVCSKKGRFRNQLIGRIFRGGTTYDDIKISPVIRQALLHWGYTLTEKDYIAYCKLKKWI